MSPPHPLSANLVARLAASLRPFAKPRTSPVNTQSCSRVRQLVRLPCFVLAQYARVTWMPKLDLFGLKAQSQLRGPRAFILGCIRIAQHAIVGACRTSKTHPRHTPATTMRPVSHACSGCLGGSSRTDVRPPAKPGSGLVLNPPQATCRRCTRGYDSKSIHTHAPPSQPCGAIAHAPALAAQALGWPRALVLREHTSIAPPRPKKRELQHPGFPRGPPPQY